MRLSPILHIIMYGIIITHIHNQFVNSD